LIAVLLLFGFSRSHGQTTIVTDTVIPTSTCPGAFMLIPFQVTNPTFNPGNVFYAEWSNAFGSFANPDTIGSIPFIFGGQGIIFASIPQDAGFGLLYRVRVVSSNPEVIGSQCPLPIFVTAIGFSANISANPSDPQCEGEEVTLTAGLGIGLGATYAWSTGATDGPSIVVTDPGSYVVTVTSLGCDVVSDPFTLDMLPLPPQPAITILPNGNFQADPQSGYQWYLNGNPIPGANSQVMSPGQPGYYHVVTSGANGCQSPPSARVAWVRPAGTLTGSQIEPFRDTIIHWIPGVINPDTSTVDTTTPPLPTYTDYSIRVYPNPAGDYLIVETNTLRSEKIYFTLYDMNGRTMYTSPRVEVLGHYKRKVDISSFPAGIYNLQLYVWGHLRTLNIQKR
jgi:hypothetical protein